MTALSRDWKSAAMKKEQPYNPLDNLNLANSVADAMLAKPVGPLPPEQFEGAGIYAIYYTGKFKPYKKISKQNIEDEFSAPIYVGKAIPAGGRKGGNAGKGAGFVLFNRLSEHAESIRQSKNLKIEDFKCRFLITEEVWIPLGESLLIQMFRPLWNLSLDGFGNHDPGAGRRGQKKSPWDVIHPGRPWAEKLTGVQRGENEILADIKRFLDQPAPPEATIKKPRRKIKLDSIE